MVNNAPVRIGFAGLYFSNFQAKEHRVFEESMKTLRGLSETIGFELVARPEVIQDLAVAQEAADVLAGEGIDFLLLQASSLMLGDIIEVFGRASERVGFWVVPEPRLTGELPLNSLTGFNLGVSILRKRFPERPVKWFYGSPDGNEAFVDRLRVTLRGLRALKNLDGSRIGIMHDVVPTFLNLTYNAEALKRRLGVVVDSIPLGDVFARYRTAEKDDRNDRPDAIEGEMRKAATKIRVPRAEVRKSAVITDAVLSISSERDIDALAIRCWPEFQSELHAAPCASVSYLNDHGLITSCEGDLPGAISMLAARHISGLAPTMNDPVALDMDENLIQMWHCGPGPVSWADDDGQTLDWHHTLNRRVPEGEAKYGVSSDISFKPGAVTILHVAGDASSLFVVEGEVVSGPSKPYPGSGGWIGNLRCNGCDVTAADFLENISIYGFEHHYPIMRGHHEAAIREFASWAGIEVLEVHQANTYVVRKPGPPGGIRSS